MTWPALLRGPWVAANVGVALSTVALSTHSPARRFTLSSPEVAAGAVLAECGLASGENFTVSAVDVYDVLRGLSGRFPATA